MKIKYPRTFHLPWSEGKTSDDKVLSNIDHFKDQYVIVTEKMDGENTTLYNDTLHARSIDSRNHPSRNWLKLYHSKIAHNIPIGWRICGENLYAKHSIHYNELKSYFLVFSIWNAENICCDWNSTKEYAELLELQIVPVLWEGIFDIQLLMNLSASLNSDNQEGYVIRLANEFKYENFNKSVAKFVRKNHVQSNKHWMHQTIIPNQLGELNDSI